MEYTKPSESGRFNSSSPLGRSGSSNTHSLQSLSSILNNPHASDSSSWWPNSSTPTPEFTPILTSKPLPHFSLSDFNPYIQSLNESYTRFEDIRKHSDREVIEFGGTAQGEALAAALREVPALYFKEDFALEEGGTFRAACPFANFAENVLLQEKLSQYLDVVEVHLVKEISLRSDSFFEAQGQLEDLNGRIVEGCGRIRELKETVRLLDSGLVDSARRIQELSGSRGNLLVLQQKLRLILYVNQAISALKLLVASGDCAGALDVTDDLQNLMEGEELAGLHCFRHLRDHVTAAIDAVNSILSAEFMRTSLHDTGNIDEVILSKAKARANLLRNGEDDEVRVDEDDASTFRDRFLPVTVGLLRTAKLPSVLRIYRDTGTAAMKGAIKTAVAELLPVLLTRPMDSDSTPGDRAVDTDGGGSSLASKLRSLSSESFIQLLEAIFNIITAHLMHASEVKRAIEWIMCNIDGHSAADSVNIAIALGSVASEVAQVDQASSVPSHSRSHSVPSLQLKATDGTSTSNLSKNFRADVLRENTEAVFAACDIAHGRWAKLLGVRALVHPRLKLQEFLSIFNVTQEFIAATEKIGGRLGYSIRGTLQSQAKAFVDFQHESRMAKIKAVLDQETWSEVDVPQEFQAIVTSLFSPESLSHGEDNGQDNNSTSDEVVASNDGLLSNSQGNSLQPESLEASVETTTVERKSNPVASLPQTNNTNSKERKTSLPQTNNTNSKERKTSQILTFEGLGYHMVNCGLILLKMLSEYIEINNYLPLLSSEVVHRVVELLKFFNTRTCQLVLGAGAMQVSGLKSITSKHLALASQVVSFTYAIIPEIRRILFMKVPETRKALLLLEIDRVAQDYKVHRDEIHTKLVQIMRERLLVHLRSLPQIVEGWNRVVESDLQPSQFARSLTKEVGYLQRVLSRTLHEVDVQAIFRQVVVIFHSQISEAFSQLEISTPQAQNRLRRDVEHILGCVRSLPSDSPSKNDVPNWGQLDEFLGQRITPVDD